MRRRTVLGLMSGTSMDGIDVALVSIDGTHPEIDVEPLDFRTAAYPEDLVDDLRSVRGTGDVDPARLADLDRRVGEAFAAAAAPLAAGVDLVGSHGQTLFHRGRRDGRPAATLQVGCGDRIAERLGVDVVSDFRRADVDAGGEGGPLSPYADFVLFRKRRRGTAVLNLGGIANVTFLTDRLGDVRAFDTGPANCLLDAAARDRCGEPCDRDGRRALRGLANGPLLARLMEHPFLDRPPPKSADPADFPLAWVDALPGARALPPDDLLATLAAFTAQSAAEGIGRHAAGPIDRLVVAGGGARNPALMDGLRRALEGVEVISSDEHGVPADAREGIAFAILADAYVRGFPAGLPAVTGASRACLLGHLSRPPA